MSEPRGTGVLIVGSGAREHALAWKLRQSPDLGALWVVPGNAGTAVIARNVPIAATDLPGLLRFAVEMDVDLTVVGPEAPLAAGIVDLFGGHGRRIFGPCAAAARLEASKVFAKEVMDAAGVPTADYNAFVSAGAALASLEGSRFPVVVKADGLAAGKGVVVCHDREQAESAVTAMMIDQVHGAAGARVIVEEALNGIEVSLLALVCGEQIVPLPVAQDHKRLRSGDTGPNTGGMGAYAPVSFLSPRECARLVDGVLCPVVGELAKRGVRYDGILYAGLMLTREGPRVLEFNCRLGDPEAQVILPLLEGDLLPWLMACAEHDESFYVRSSTFNADSIVPIAQLYTVGVVLAGRGYPDAPETGQIVDGLEDVADDVLVFHGGTAHDASGRVVTAGGRVLTVVGRGSTVDEAATAAYAAPIHFEGMHRRDDIGQRARRVHCLPALAEPVRSQHGHTPRIGVLVSGGGSNMQALLDACGNGELAAEVAVVISSRANAYALERARALDVPAMALPLRSVRDGELRRRFEEDLLSALLSSRVDLLVLAGWMLVLSQDFLSRAPWPVINVHPALLPDDGGDFVHIRVAGTASGLRFQDPAPRSQVARMTQSVTADAAPMEHSQDIVQLPALRGMHAVADALRLALPITGVTVHYVTPQVDAGPVIIQEIVPIMPHDDEASLYARIKPVEHRLLVEAVRTVLTSPSEDRPAHGRAPVRHRSPLARTTYIT